ncbi:MAG: hypothetical protein FVQ79_03395 [Planctomycetes bacterium]|nr:hypothetical protein [Planctomycetota bacterium]
MIKQINGEHLINDYIAPASQPFDFNDVVTRNSAGKLVKATATTPRSEILGLIQKDILSTDSDYASDKVVPVLESHKEAEYDFDVDTGTALVAMVGQVFDLNDEDGLNVDSNLQGAVRITRLISTTQVRGKFVTAGKRFELRSYQQVVAFGGFTDGGGAAGTLDLAVSIPAGAVFERVIITAITGFAGDSSAVLQVGDGTTVDRYNTGSPSIFATAAAGADLGAPSGTRHHSAAKTPRLTVTAGSDWGAVTAGAATVTLFWYDVA